MRLSVTRSSGPGGLRPALARPFACAVAAVALLANSVATAQEKEAPPRIAFKAKMQEKAHARFTKWLSPG